MRLVSQKAVTRHVVSLREDGILHIHVSNEPWNIEDKKLLYPVIGEMVNYKQVPLLITYAWASFPSSEELVNYAERDFTCPYFKADAIVTDSMPLKILGNFFLQRQEPLRPTRLFEKEEDAILWLKDFV